jgi:hypothetical protein
MREEDEMDLGRWLLNAEARCSRVGNRRARLDSDRDRITRIMAQWKLARDEKSVHAHEEVEPSRKDPPALEVLHAHADHVPTLQDVGKKKDPPVVDGQHARDGGTKSKKIGKNKDPHVIINSSKRAVPSPEYKLTSYAAWWKRVEKDEIDFYKEVRKEEEFRRKKREENRRKEEGKKKFLKKFFPNCDNSPGGKVYLRGVPRTEYLTSGAVGKMVDGRTVLSDNILYNENL